MSCESIDWLALQVINASDGPDSTKYIANKFRMAAGPAQLIATKTCRHNHSDGI
jgi:hypothetical protein